MEKCNRDCLNCVLEKCVEDRQISLNLPSNKADRREYMKMYYQKHKKAKSDYYKEYYKAHKVVNTSNFDYRVNYVKFKDVTDTIKRLRAELGNQNVELILRELSNLELKKYRKCYEQRDCS